jgi:2-succinyl-5-enolpyruvyl-6-hydroxy-3-cyclohexene-1-carboxylate synthase
VDDGTEARPEDVQASACATLVDEWARAGVTDAVVCPGSRSTPLALALHGDDRIRVHVHHDERAGAFTALGLGLASGRPAVVLTTSGTAAAEVHAAVVEAHQASVPLIVATADRPPELADVGAAQTIDQIRLYGAAVRWFDAPGVPDLAARSTWRARAARSHVEAVGAGGAGRPGPVHLDLAFREPLVGTPAHVPPGRPDGAPWVRTAPLRVEADLDGLGELLAGARRGIVVAGTAPGEPVTGPGSIGAVAPRLAALLGWPLLVDARVRGGLVLRDDATVVGTADALLRDADVADALRPDLVLHLGAPVASRIVGEWITGSGAVEVRVGAHGWTDPAHTAALRLAAPVASLVEADLAAPATETGWADRWRRAETAAQEAIDATLAGETAPTEAGTARSVLAALHDGEHLVVSSSMPIRDVEWFGRPRSGVVVHANRGANGIDGVVSTAVGVALATGAPTTCLVGDVALLHDGNALLGAAARGIDLTVVVVDNDGGGIFSFLPQATTPGDPAFEELFGTPHGVDLRVLAAAHGLDTVEPADPAEVAPALRASLAAGGVRLVRIPTARPANVTSHRALTTAITTAAKATLLPNP